MVTQLDSVELVRQTALDVKHFVAEVERLYNYDAPVAELRDRRLTQRLLVTMPVRIFPLTDDLQPRNFECRGVTRDISHSGVGLVTADPISGKYLRLEFEAIQDRRFSVIAKVEFNNVNGFYFHVGCSYLNWDYLA